jgi:hypothetical protein
MSDTDFTKPGLGRLRAAAEVAELTHAESGLASAYRCRLAGSDPLAPLAHAIARSMTKAGLPMHHCMPHDPLYRLDGTCLLPVPAKPADGRAGTAVSWTTHNLLRLDGDRYGTYAGIQQAMNAAIGGIMRAFGYVAEPFGSGGAWLVTGPLLPGPGGGTVTAIAVPDSGVRSLPVAGGGVDRAIRVSTAVVVLAVAGIAAYISYWHAYAVVREYGESGVTALLEPATIDGLVYASSMVILHAARHRLPVPRLARWMLALGIVASLAVNVAQGWSHGLVGAVVAAWPAVSLVGSYELLAWIIRTAAPAGPDRVSATDHGGPQADQPGTSLWPASSQVREAGPVTEHGHGASPASEGESGQLPVARTVTPVRGPGPHGPGQPDHTDRTNQASGPDWNAPDHADRVDRLDGTVGPPDATRSGSDVDAAAVAAYRASVREGRPLSERKLAETFGKTSRRWARNRMAEARQGLVPVLSPGSPQRIPGRQRLVAHVAHGREYGHGVQRSYLVIDGLPDVPADRR